MVAMGSDRLRGVDVSELVHLDTLTSPCSVGSMQRQWPPLAVALLRIGCEGVRAMVKLGAIGDVVDGRAVVRFGARLTVEVANFGVGCRVIAGIVTAVMVIA